jgi:hypothetical protein
MNYNYRDLINSSIILQIGDSVIYDFLDGTLMEYAVRGNHLCLIGGPDELIFMKLGIADGEKTKKWTSEELKNLIIKYKI